MGLSIDLFITGMKESAAKRPNWQVGCGDESGLAPPQSGGTKKTHLANEVGW